MSKSGIILIVITILIMFGGAYLFSKPTEIPTLSGYEYFWGNGCPHCEIVDEFYQTWEGKDKISVKKLEVWSNTKNAELMAERAKNCEIPRTGMGVPLLVTPEGKCLIGSQPIIDHYKQLEL
ncbi:MAG: hypothetical protein QY322_03820 [bacterium]|nr:MAG: hypothetical protein QY322_03820 [bacterium]